MRAKHQVGVMHDQRPRTQAGATSVEVCGFVGWTSTAVAYVLFLLWAYIPEETLQKVGVTYYPSKYWAIALPAWACVAVVTAYLAYKSCNCLVVCSRHTLNAHTDDKARRPEDMLKQHHATSIPPLMDLPIDKVSEALHFGCDQITGS